MLEIVCIYSLPWKLIKTEIKKKEILELLLLH